MKQVFYFIVASLALVASAAAVIFIIDSKIADTLDLKLMIAASVTFNGWIFAMSEVFKIKE